MIRHSNILGRNRRKKVSIVAVGGPPPFFFKTFAAEHLEWFV